MNGQVLLSSRRNGDRLVLTAAGPWTAVHAHELEPLIDVQTNGKDAVRAVDIDLAQVKPLDTFGAWLIERLARAFTARGAETRILGLPEDYRGLVDEVQGANLKPAVPQRQPYRFIVALNSIGRALVNVGHTLVLILQMTGAVTSVFMRAVIHPTRFRWTSLVVHIDRVGWHGGADHAAGHLPDRRHPVAAGHLSFPQIRRRHLSSSTWSAS